MKKVPAWLNYWLQHHFNQGMVAHNRNNFVIWFGSLASVDPVASCLNVSTLLLSLCEENRPLICAEIFDVDWQNFVCWIGNASLLSFSLTPSFLRGRGWHYGHHLDWHRFHLHPSVPNFSAVIFTWTVIPKGVWTCHHCLYCLYWLTVLSVLSVYHSEIRSKLWNFVEMVKFG